MSVVEENTTVVLVPLAVDTETAARMLGVSPLTVRAYMRRGELIPKYCGTKPIFPVEELRYFLEHLPSESGHR